MAERLHTTCQEVTTVADYARGDRSYVCGQGCPPVPIVAPQLLGEADRVRAREARRRVYAQDQRRAAARALDKYIETMFDEEQASTTVLFAGERFVEAVGEYVLSRMGDAEQELQHSGDSVVSVPCECRGSEVPHDPGLRGCIYGPGGTLEGKDPLARQERMPPTPEHLFDHDSRDTCPACEPAAVTPPPRPNDLVYGADAGPEPHRAGCRWSAGQCIGHLREAAPAGCSHPDSDAGICSDCGEPVR